MTALDVRVAPGAGGAGRRHREPVWSRWSAPALAGGLALLGALVGWKGIDLPAQLYRVTMFHQVGLSTWDPQWYSGHWGLSYSVVYPPVAATLGMTATAAISAAVAALAFDRLVVAHFGRSAWVGSMLFAVGTTEQLAIGQLAFLMGEALALAACWAATRRRVGLATALAVACSLASPLAGAFLALAALAWVIAGPPNDRRAGAAILVAAAVPLVADAVMFSGQGSFPFPFGDLAFELPAAVVMWIVVPRRDRALRAGAALYIAATAASFVVRTPVGGNVGRLGECLAVPLGACVLWPRRRLLLVVLALPMALWQWTPAWAAITNANTGQPSVHRGYFTPLLDFLASTRQPVGRLEVVPTKFHWEADFVAPTVPLARGWERQLDIGVDPIFYGGHLDATSYHAWLVDDGVRYVALPDAPLDYAATTEARLLETGVAGLRPVWQNAHWQVWAVDGSPGIVSGPAQLVRMSGEDVEIDATGPGTVIVRVHTNPDWSVTSGPACVTSRGGWVALETSGAGTVNLAVRLGGGAHRC